MSRRVVIIGAGDPAHQELFERGRLSVRSCSSITAWTHPPGGVPGAALAGREVVQLLCRADERPFRTTLAV